MSVFHLDRHVVDVLLRDLVGHDHSPAAFIVYLFLSRRAAGTREKRVRLSHNQIAQETGLSKSAVQAAFRTLHRRSLISSERRHQTDTPSHQVLRPWIRTKTTD